MVDAATGGRAVFGRAIEKTYLGVPQGTLEFLNFDAVDISRLDEENVSNAITGFEGSERGTPGDIKFQNKIKYALTPARFLFDCVAAFGAPASVTDLSGGAWLVKIRPSRSNAVRGASLYLYEGGSYAATLQTGRRAEEILLTDGANKRTEVQTTYSDPTGDTISGFIIGKSSNDTYIGDQGLKFMTRGRRPYDSNFTDGKSLYLKVTAINGGVVTVKAGYDAPSGATDGSGFPTVSYDSHTVDIPVASSGFDGYTGLLDPAAGNAGNPLGLFGENFEAFELTFGADVSGMAVNDEFEIPVAMPALTKSVTAESRLSAFHLIRKIGGSTDVRLDKGTTKIDRPYKAYRANGRRIPQAIDPQGDSSVTFSFSKRLFDRYFRAISDAHSRFEVHDVYKVETQIGTSGFFETVELYAPQCAVTGLKSGDIATKNVLEETVTLRAEQPDSAPSAPSGFDSSAAYPFQINVTTKIDPTWLS